MNYRNQRARAFTLIELLVVIAIIGLLASIILASLGGSRSKARDGRRVSDIKQIQLALSLYYDNVGSYPVCSPPCSGVAFATALGTNVLSPAYITVLPADPSNSGTLVYSYASTVNTPASGPCNTAGGCYGYVMQTVLENANSNASNGLNGTFATLVCNTTTNYCVAP